MPNVIEAEHPGLRLARFLKEFVGLRMTTVRDIGTYDTVIWFGDMPQGRDCQSCAWTDDRKRDDPWLEVRKQAFDPKPEPPEVMLPWLDEQALGRAEEIPQLRDTILVKDEDVELDEGESPPFVERSIVDFPDVRRAYERYRPKWQAWSQEQRRRQAIQEVFARLFELHTQVQKQGEVKEVCLGLGLLDWQAPPKGPPIRRHVVVARVELRFDTVQGVIRVEPPGDGAGLQIEDDMLEAELRPDRAHYDALKTQLDEVGDDIWDAAQMHTALKGWSASLSANMEWIPSLDARTPNAQGAICRFAPALILRDRPQTGMARIYDKLIKQLSDDSSEPPMGWRGLTEDLADDGADIDQKPEPELFFPLPANREQRKIVEAISRKRGVLVQGPPGTGKSQTIANLICHLLATGKRVVVTAETTRALKVLKNLLPKDIRALCVSLLGQGGDFFAALNEVVQEITTRYNSYSPGLYDNRIDAIDRELDKARRLLAETESEIRSLRENETTPHVVAGGTYHGTASEIAKRVSRERDRYKWLRLPREACAEAPVSNEEISKWLTMRRYYSEEQIAQARLRIPPTESLREPPAFSEAVAKEREATKSSMYVRSCGATPHTSFFMNWHPTSGRDGPMSFEK